MKLLLSSYDLHLPGRHYAELHEAYRKAGAVRLLESVWLSWTNQSAISLRDTIGTYLDGNDDVAVIEITPEAHWATLGCYKSGVSKLQRYRP
jgi:hypothetical protein